MYTDIVASILSQSGWSEDRCVEIDQWVEQLESEGFTLIPDVKRILREFGGLKIPPVKAPSDTFAKGQFYFDPVSAASGDFDKIEYWQNHLGITLSPFAEGSKAEMLLLASDGRVFASYHAILFLVGSSFEDAVENTFTLAKNMYVEFGRIQD
jgi:hypothetical protein